MGNRNKGQVKKEQISVLNLIWVDSQVGDAEQEEYKRQFRYMFNYCFYFDSVERFELHFKEYVHHGFEKYFVIVSEDFVEQIMNLANEQIMVECVFIHSDGVEDENEPNVLDDHQKIQCVDDDIQKIIQQIKNTGRTQSHVSQSCGQEFHFMDQVELMNSIDIEYILNFTFKNEESIETAIKEFGQFSIEYIEKFYIDPTEQLQQDENLQSLVNDFYEEEANSKLIQAFVEEESFFYKMLNHVFDEGNMVNLFFIRAGLYILQQQINHYSETDTFKLPKLYWGTYIAKNEFEIWQIDRKPFIFYGYYITTSNRLDALKNIDHSFKNIPKNKQGNYIKLLIEININYENEDQHIAQPICLAEISNLKKLDDYLLNLNQLVLCKEVKQQKKLGYVEIITELSNFQSLKLHFNANILERKQQIERMLKQEYPVEHFYMANFLSLLGKGTQMQLVLERVDQLSDEKQQVNKLNYIGIAYYLNGQYDMALENHEKALEIQKQNFGPDHPDSAVTYNNIGLVYCIQGQSDEALESFQKTLQIQKYSKGIFDECLSITYNNIATVYKNMGDFDKSLEYFEQALMVKKSAFDHYNTSIAIAYSNIGTIYYIKQQYRKSVEYFVKALQIQEQLTGETHPSIAIYYTNIAVGFIKLDLNKKALQYLEKSLQINIQATGEQSLQTAKSYLDIALYYKNNEQKQISIDNYHKAYQIIKLFYSENHPQLTKIIDQIKSLQ